MLLWSTSVVWAFSAADRGLRQPPHDTITDQALAWARRRGAVPGPVPSAVKLERGLHKVLQLQDGLELGFVAVESTLGRPGPVLKALAFGRGERSNQLLRWRVGDVLTTRWFDPTHHFQRADVHQRSSDAWRAGLQEVDDQLRAFGDSAARGEFACAMVNLGRALHTVQDAVSSSNLAELSFGQECLFGGARGGTYPHYPPLPSTAFEAPWHCLIEGNACKDVELDELRLVVFPSWWTPGAQGPAPEAWSTRPSKLPCDDNADPVSCWDRRTPDRTWRIALSDACVAVRKEADSTWGAGVFAKGGERTGPGPSIPAEDRFVHPCYGHTFDAPFVRGSLHGGQRRWEERAYQRAELLAVEASAALLARAYERVGDPAAWELILKAELGACSR